MSRIPIKFNRVAAAFDEAARWRRPCESSSGSEYWPDSGTDLSDLVNSFIEKGDGLGHLDIEIGDTEDHINYNEDGIESDANWVSDNDDYDLERKELLRDLLLECKSDNKRGTKQKIWDEIEAAFNLISEDNVASLTSRSGLKRKLMAHLRDKGFDAGLCKSRWDKTGRFPAGTYEYIDINVGKTRYIIEVFLAGELEIIRPTTRYTTLLGMIPSILIVEKPQVLKQIMRLMSAAMKESLKHADIHVAPWRRNGYMQARYFSPYKRTTNRESASNNVKMVNDGLTKKRSMVGFEAELPSVSYYCRSDDFASKAGVRVGLLAATLGR